LPGMSSGYVPPLAPQHPAAIDPGFNVQGAPDVSAANALNELSRLPPPISGEAMMLAIKRGVGDLDGKSTTSELQMFKDFAKKNADKLSPEAHTCVGIYEKYAQAAGSGGIPQAEFGKMLGEMKNVRDASMYHALGALSSQQGPITGAQMGDALIRGLSDHDGKATTTELDQVKQWAKDNESKLSPAAKMAVRIYVDFASKAGQSGAPGLTSAEMGTLRRRLQGAALADDLQ
ncbi:MAG: hypothetical protein JNK82_36065, partial [Myxococcaceae bacterium]|nr:hypothetical protein [Myxococcaceae bacterium]